MIDAVLLTKHTGLRQLGGMSSPFDGSSTLSQNPYTDPSMMETEVDKSFSQSTLQQTTLQQTAQRRLNSNDAAIAQREREINEIAKGIIELADIFKDLQMMIIDQGTMLDRIDYNIENTVVNVKEAEKELVVVSLHTLIVGQQYSLVKYRLLDISASPSSARSSCFFSCWSLACSFSCF